MPSYLSSRYQGIYPAIAGVRWAGPNTQERLAHLDAGVLSVIQIKFILGFSVTDTTSPEGKLWLATQEYISTIPGCERIFWGTETEPDLAGENVCLLIQWENAMSWGKFQMSMGLSLMLGLLREKPSNRCIRLSLPRFVTTPQVLRLFYYTFEKKPLVEERERLSQEWESMEGMWEKEGAQSCGDWVEDDVVWAIGDLKETVIAEDSFFCGIIFGGIKKGGKAEREILEGKLTKTVSSVSVRKFWLSQSVQSPLQTIENILSPKPENHLRVDGFASLIRATPYRRYSELKGVQANIDSRQEKSITSAKAGERIGAGPHGGFLEMGCMNQYMKLVIPYIELEGKRKLGVELYFLSLKPGVVDSEEFSKHLLDFRCRILEVDGFHTLLWCPSMEKPDECALIISWSTDTARVSNLLTVDNLLRETIAKLSSLVQAPRNFTLSSTAWTKSSISRNYSPIELITFEISDCPRTRDILKRFYADFESTTEINGRIVTTPVPRGHACNGYFFHGQPLFPSSISWVSGEGKDGIKKVQFTGMTGSSSVAALEEWYSDFVPGCATYERLGHKIDALRCFCSEGLENFSYRTFNVTMSQHSAEIERRMRGRLRRIRP